MVIRICEIEWEGNFSFCFKGKPPWGGIIGEKLFKKQEGGRLSDKGEKVIIYGGSGAAHCRIPQR